MNSLGIAIQSGSILLREGLEAILIVTALAGAMRRAGIQQALRPIYWGALAAIAASIAAGAIFYFYFNGAHNDLVEAAVMILAAALMIYMSGWLFLRRDPGAFKREIERSAAQAISGGTFYSLASIAFLSVFREGAETVLFLHALATSTQGWTFALIGGLIAAAVALAALFAAMQWLAMRLPLRPIFLITSAFLFIMGLRFIGGAIQELQEQTIIPVDNADVPDWVISLGFNPTWEALLTQLVIVIIAAASLVWLTTRKPGQGGTPGAHQAAQ